MTESEIKEKVIRHMDGLHALERQQDIDKVIDVIAQREDVPRNVVKKVLAEWQAGKDMEE